MKRTSMISNYTNSGARMQDFFDFYNSIKEFNSNGETKSTKVRYSYSGDINKDNNKEKRNNNPPNQNVIKNKDDYIKGIYLFIDDTKTRISQLIIKNYICKFIFDNDTQLEFRNLIHFTSKYFEFPIFYFYKGDYNDETKITTITLKDYRSYKIKSGDGKVLNQLRDFANNTLDYFKYAIYHKKMQEKDNIKYPKDGWTLYDPFLEYLRQEIEFSDTKFCFSFLNKEYKLCDSYPNIVVIPKEFDNEEILNVAGSRMKNRFPVLTFYYHKINYVYDENNVPKINNEIRSYLYRSAQIKTSGIIFKSKNLEIKYINRIMNMEKNNSGFIIFDCRPAIVAKAHSLKGAGVEDIKVYNNCKKLIFGDIENIHAVRKSLKKALLKAYYGKESIIKGKIAFNIDNSNMKNFLSKFEDTKWLEYISDILLGSITVSNYLMKGINVLVHCSDGWDRTSQVCSLAQIILEPYYRTIEGFAVLIEKDWMSFGHQFSLRNGCDFRKEKKNERAPIFIQFIHCVHQMLLQYPTAFEFNSNFLLFLSREVYSNKYGNFLFNSEKDLLHYKAQEKTISIWSDVLLEKNKYINDIYKKLDEPISIQGELQYLSIWNEYFFQFDKLGRVKENNIVFDKSEYVANVVEEKKESILELLKVIKNNGLESQIKNNKFYNLFKEELK